MSAQTLALSSIKIAAIALTTLLPQQTFSAMQSEAGAMIKAGSIVAEVGGSERINFSGKLRMLSQRIPAAACNLSAGIAPETSRDLLRSATAEFSKILTALEFGDETLGIYGVEERRKTLVAIEATREKWLPVKTAAKTMLAGETSDAQYMKIAKANMPLLDAAKLLVSEISGQYSDPTALLQSDAIRIDLAGRQRMLTQKISKEVCHVKSDIDAQAAAEAVSGTVNMFDATLNALRFGMPAAGVIASTNSDIIAGLETVADDWGAFKSYMTALESGQEWDDTKRADVFKMLNSAMVNMNKVVGMYAEESKLGL